MGTEQLYCILIVLNWIRTTQQLLILYGGLPEVWPHVYTVSLPLKWNKKKSKLGSGCFVMLHVGCKLKTIKTLIHNKTVEETVCHCVRAHNKNAQTDFALCSLPKHVLCFGCCIPARDAGVPRRLFDSGTQRDFLAWPTSCWPRLVF